MSWTRSISADRSYHLVDLGLCLFFIGLLLASLLPDGAISCQRRAAGLDCTGCGLSRSFRALLTGGEYPATALGLRLFIFCMGQIFTRVIISIALISGLKARRLLIIDLLIGIPWLVYSFWPVF